MRRLSLAWMASACILVCGVLFPVSMATAQSYHVIYAFQSSPDGMWPTAKLLKIQDTLFGTTEHGGDAANCFDGCGTVFKVTLSGTETILYRFCPSANCTDGEIPLGGLVADASGNLYGTTAAGGLYGNGTVFKITPDGTESVLYSFCAQANCGDGANPVAGLIRDSVGNLYGTTQNGGNGLNKNSCRDVFCGTVFKLAPDGTETVLYSFCQKQVTTGTRACVDGSGPLARLIMDKKGELFGTTAYGGAGNGGGTAFRLEPNGSESALYSFCNVVPGHGCTDGVRPFAELKRDSTGNFFGTTRNGGKNGAGTVFRISKDGVHTILYSFGTDGDLPDDGVIEDSNGNLFGTTTDGGNQSSGVVFEVTQAGNYSVLYAFCQQQTCADGDYPEGGLVQDAQGNLFGTTLAGGANLRSCDLDAKSGCGTVFELTQATSPKP